MTDETAGSSIGTARVDVVVDTSTLESSIASTKSKISDFSQAAQDAYNRMDAAQKRATDSAIKQAAAFGKTRDQIILMNAAAKGVPTSILDEMAASMAKVSTATTSAGHAVEEFTLNNSNSRRELGRLASDLANGNYGRFQQTALTLANYSGLMGKAFSLAGLGVGVLGAAVATALVGFYKGEQETEAYNRALILTGNYAGETTDQLRDMAREQANGITTQGQYAAALTAVAASGKFTAGQIRLVGTAAVNMQELTGQSVDQTVQQFEQLKQAPLAAILSLNDAQHFLTLAQYDQIKALQDQGHEQAAATLAMNTYADTIATRKTDAVANLGLIEKAMRGLVSAGKAAADAALNIGRSNTGQQIFDGLSANLDRYNSEKAAGQQFDPNSGQDLDTIIASTRAKMSAMQDALVAQQKQASKDALSAQVVQDKADSDAEVLEYATNAQKRATAILKVQGEYNDRIARAVQAGNTQLAAQLRASEQLVVAGVNQKFKDPKQSKTDPFASINGLVQKAQVDDSNFGLGNNQQTEQVTRILAIVDAGAKLIKSGHDVAEVQALVATGVGSLNDLYAKQADQLTAKNDAAYQQYIATLDKADDVLQRQTQNNVLRLSMGDKEYQQLSQINEITQQGIEAQQKLQAERDGVLAKNGDTSLLDKEIAAQQADTDKRVAIVRQGFVQMDAAQSDWVNGAIAAMQDYADQGANVAGQTKTLFTDAFDSMNTALLDFATTGKLNFKSFVTSVLTDLAKMELRVAESQVLQSIIGAFAGGYGGTNGSGSVVSDSNGFVTHVNAKGGVYHSPSLSAYSSQIVNKPTMFAFANGAGLMGEAGPEAIMPLKRDSQGRLGVQSGAGGGGNVFNFTSNTAVSSDGTAKTQTSGDSRSALGKQLNDQMTQAAQAVLVKAVRPGGLLWRQQTGS